MTVSAERFERVLEALQEAAQLIQAWLPSIEELSETESETAIDIARVLRQEQSQQYESWQPMDTAPKDGSNFLVWWQRDGGVAGGVIVATYVNFSNIEAGFVSKEVPVISPSLFRYWQPLPNRPTALDNHGTPLAAPEAPSQPVGRQLQW